MLQCPQCGRHYPADLRACPEDGTALQADATVAERIHSDPLVGRVLDDKYRLDERLGEGGMGAVYRATHLLIDRPVAVKVLHPRFVEDEAAQQRFRREARAAGRLQHPNAVAVTDFGSTGDGFVYIVMELLEGEDLRELLTRESPLDFGRATGLMAQTAAAVAAAHEAGVIHRDLKPANIFVMQRRNLPPIVKVLDFGIAKLAAESVEEIEANRLTQTGIMIGTPRYMSPEQCDGAHLTPASDVYSLGIIFYELLTGAVPFNGASPLAVAMQHSSKTPAPPSELRHDLPLALEQVVLHALAKSPQERPPDAGVFHKELLEAATQLGLDNVFAGASPTGELPRRAPSINDTSPLGVDRQRYDTVAATNVLLIADASDQTVLADTSAARRSAVTAPATTAATQDNLTDLPPRTITRMEVPVRGGWPRSQRMWLFVGLGIGALLLSAGVAAFVQRRGAMVNLPPAAITSTPAPAPVVNATPLATPTPEPTPTPNEADKKPSPARRSESSKPAPVKQDKPSRIGKVVKGLKKIFKNPF